MTLDGSVALFVLVPTWPAPNFVEDITESGQFHALDTEVLGVNLNGGER